MKRIAVFTSDDYAWSFEAWHNTIPLLQQEYEVCGIYVFPDMLPKLRGVQIPRWYLKTFGWRDFIILSLFAMQKRLGQLVRGPRSWRGLARSLQVPLLHGGSPNDATVVAWIKDQRIDVVMITVSTILKSDIIAAPTLGIINKHAALLPQAKGLFPYVWSRIHDLPVGVTLHQVDARVDTGPILVQEQYQNAQASMLQFYIDVFARFPILVTDAVQCLVESRWTTPPVQEVGSYFSLPTPVDVAVYRAKLYQVSRLSDLMYRSSPESVFSRI